MTMPEQAMQEAAAAIIKRTQDEAHADAVKAAAETLARFVPVIAAQATCKPLFSKELRRDDSRRMLCRVIWPGVVQVIEPGTGVLLAESAPGSPHQLAHGFVPHRTLG